MNQKEIKEIEDTLEVTTYGRNKAKAIGNDIADIMSKIELATGLAESDLIDKSVYIQYVQKQRKEIKTLTAYLFNFLNLNNVEGRFDNVFEQKDVYIECPHCHHHHEDWQNYIDGEDMEGIFPMNCETCGKEFTVEFETILSFKSKK